VLSRKGKINIKNKSYNGQFSLDTGYQKALLLDSVLMHEQSFPKDLKLLKVNKLRNGAGDTFITKVLELVIVKEALYKLPVQLLNTANPVGFKIHILGNEVLKRFNTILDFKNMTIYFQKNNLFNMPYSDAF
jgi:hypothetical protein